MFQILLKNKNSQGSIQKHLNHYYQTVYPFYLENGHEHTLKGSKANISCRYFIHPNTKAKIIIVNGYNESYLKYAEVIFDLYKKNFSIYTYDHRGQGFSDKFPNQKNRGFLNDFNELVDDLEIFFKFVQNHDKQQDIFMLAHSMGGAVATLATGRQKILPKKLALSAPMMGIKLSPLPILEYPIYLSTVLFSKLGLAHTFAFGQSDCFPLIPFEKNVVTHSKARYQIWQEHIRTTPQVQLGGPTFQWVKESIKASREARAITNPGNQIPILLLQAEKEDLVLNNAHEIFVHNWHNAQLKVISNAKHEILMEIDSIRNTVLHLIFNFFS